MRCEPPRLILFTWKAPDWEAPTEVEVRFSAAPDGTRVELEHRGFETDPQMRERGKGFAGGWDTVLAHYVEDADR